MIEEETLEKLEEMKISITSLRDDIHWIFSNFSDSNLSNYSEKTKDHLSYVKNSQRIIKTISEEIKLQINQSLEKYDPK
jgi:hypothetical protein